MGHIGPFYLNPIIIYGLPHGLPSSPSCKLYIINFYITLKSV